MGIWFENFALPVVVNECLLQSYSGTLRLFPNWPLTKAAEFHTLRAVGGFLVSASCADGTVQWVRIVSEAGRLLRLMSPWQPGVVIERATVPDEVITLTHESLYG
jgi:alpha-L-fucosidase 2